MAHSRQPLLRSSHALGLLLAGLVMTPALAWADAPAGILQVADAGDLPLSNEPPIEGPIEEAISEEPPPPPVDGGLEPFDLPLSYEQPPPPAALLGPVLAVMPGRPGGFAASTLADDLMIRPIGAIGYQLPRSLDPNAQLVGQTFRHPFPTAFLPLSKGQYAVVNSADWGRESWDPRYPADSALLAGLGLGDPSSWLGFQAELGVPSVHNPDYGSRVDLKVSRDLWNTPDLRIALGAGWLGAAAADDATLNRSSQYGVLTSSWRLPSQRLPYDRLVHLNLGVSAPRLGAVDFSDPQLFASLGIETSPWLGFSTGWTEDSVIFNSTLRF